MNVTGFGPRSSAVFRRSAVAAVAVVAEFLFVRVLAPWMNSLPAFVLASMCGHSVCLPIDIRNPQGEHLNSPANDRSQ